jgi:hypothetical protein
MPIGAQTLGAVFSMVLREQYAGRRHAAEYLARDANVTPRTARAWLDGVCTPQAHSLINLMRRCEALRQEVDRLVQEGSCRDGS